MTPPQQRCHILPASIHTEMANPFQFLNAQFDAALDVQDRRGQEATKAAKAAAKSKRR